MRPIGPVSRRVALLLALTGCGKKAQPAAAGPNPGGPPPAPAQWFRGRLRQLPPWGEDLRRRIDPAVDGWPTEVWALRLEKELPPRIHAALAGDRRGLEELLAEDFRGSSAIWPAEFDTPLDDGDIAVREGKKLPGETHPRAELAALVETWAKSLSDVPERRVDVALDGLTAHDDGTFETHARVRVSGAAGKGSVQQNLRWNLTWRAPTKLLALSTESVEEVRTRVRPLSELTREVLSKCEGFDEEILRGNDDYHLHQDRLSSQPMLGMHGLAIGDVDGDGLEDLYLPQPGGQPNRLLLHQPDGTLKDGSHAAGLDFLDNSGSALILDLDNDGHEDVAVTTGSSIVICWGDGKGRFPEHTVLKGPDAPEITSLSAADPDNDGDLDLYACRYVKGGVSNGAPVPYWNAENGAADLYWRNEGGRNFVEVAKEVGLETHTNRYGLALVWEDLDEDGQIDLFVVNDFGKNCIYKNDGGKFHEIAEDAGAVYPAAGMGVTCADVDHDGNLDLFLTNMDSPAGTRIASQPRFMAAQPESKSFYVGHTMGNTLLLGDGHGKFRNVTQEAGVGPGGWAWGGTFFDLQNDGWPDLYVPNGFATNRNDEDLSSFFWRCVVSASPKDATAPAAEIENYANGWDALRHFSLYEGRSWNGRERNYAYLNLGGARFAEVSSALQADYLDDARVVAPVDWDDDGRVDLWIRNRTGPRLRFLRNVDPSTGHWITLELAGTTCNRDAIGARAYVEAGGVRLRQTVYAAEGYMCGGSRRLHFGLGKASKAERIEVRWPGGGTQSFADVAADARYRIVQGKEAPEKVAPRRHPAFDAMPDDPVRVETRDVSRIVLYERLPARDLEVPGFAPAPRTVGTFQGRPMIAWVGFGDDPASRAVLQALAARKPELDKNRVPLVAIDCGEPPAHKFLGELGVDALAGRADKRFLLDLQVLLMEVLSPFDRLAYPLVLLFDGAGQLTAVYSGNLKVDEVLLDARTIVSADPTGLSTEVLLKGRWVTPFPRNLEGLGQIFDVLGEAEMGRYYHALAAARARR